MQTNVVHVGSLFDLPKVAISVVNPIPLAGWRATLIRADTIE
jgi:hypothetical protein